MIDVTKQVQEAARALTPAADLAASDASDAYKASVAGRAVADACESIDAAVFSGDYLEDVMRRHDLRTYATRWLHAIAVHEKSYGDGSSDESNDDIPF